MRFLTVAPISPQFTDIRDVFKNTISFGHGVAIGPIPEEFRQERHSVSSLFGSTRFSLNSTLAFTCQVESPPPGTESSPAWPGGDGRLKSIDMIRFLNLSLWLAQPTAVGFELCAHHSPEALPQLQTMSPLLPLPSYRDGHLHPAALDRARSFLNLIADLPRESSVYASLRSLWFALVEDQWDVRVLLIWLGLESLFGSGATMSERAVAAFVGDDTEDLEALAADITQSYDLRSKIAHGVSLVTSDPNVNRHAVERVEILIRRSLNRLFLGDPNELARFLDEKTRKQLLEGRLKKRLPAQPRAPGRRDGRR